MMKHFASLTSKGSIALVAGLSMLTLFSACNLNEDKHPSVPPGGLDPNSKYTLTVSIDPITLPADDTSTATVVATLKDKKNNPVANQLITFDTTLGSFVPIDGIPQGAEAVTNGAGQATVTLRAGTVAGKATVAASFMGLVAGQDFFIVGREPQLFFTSTASQVFANGKTGANLEVTVFENGIPAQGAVVTFSTTIGNIFTGCGPANALTTDGNGKVFTAYQSPVLDEGVPFLNASITATATTVNGNSVSGTLQILNEGFIPRFVIDSTNTAPGSRGTSLKFSAIGALSGRGVPGIEVAFEGNGGTVSLPSSQTSSSGEIVVFFTPDSNGDALSASATISLSSNYPCSAGSLFQWSNTIDIIIGKLIIDVDPTTPSSVAQQQTMTIGLNVYYDDGRSTDGVVVKVSKLGQSAENGVLGGGEPFSTSLSCGGVEANPAGLCLTHFVSCQHKCVVDGRAQFTYTAVLNGGSQVTITAEAYAPVSSGEHATTVHSITITP